MGRTEGWERRRGEKEKNTNKARIAEVRSNTSCPLTTPMITIVIVARMLHRKRRETKQQLI